MDPLGSLSPPPVRYTVAELAARLLYSGEYKEYYQAKREAAKRSRSKVLPTNAEIHYLIAQIADRSEGPERAERLHKMRQVALEMMLALVDFHPRLVGSVWTGHIRLLSDIDLHLYSDHADPIEEALRSSGLSYDKETVTSGGQEFTHLRHRHKSGYLVEMTLYRVEEYDHLPSCSITGGPMPRANHQELSQLLASVAQRQTALSGGGLPMTTASVVPGSLSAPVRERLEVHQGQGYVQFGDLSEELTQHLLAQKVNWWKRAELSNLIGHVDRVLKLSARRVSEGELYLLFCEAGELLPELLLLTVATLEADPSTPQRPERLTTHEHFVKVVLREFFERGFYRFPNVPVSKVDLEIELGVRDEKTLERLSQRLTLDYVERLYHGREDGLDLAAEYLHTIDIS